MQRTIDVRTDTNDVLLVEDLRVLAMVVLTLVSDPYHPVWQEQLEKKIERTTDVGSRTLDGVHRVVARDVPKYQALPPTHLARQRDCHRPTCRLGHLYLVCRLVGPDGKRLRRSSGQ
jgi:hypothetical protein